MKYTDEGFEEKIKEIISSLEGTMRSAKERLKDESLTVTKRTTTALALVSLGLLTTQFNMRDLLADSIERLRKEVIREDGIKRKMETYNDVIDDKGRN